LKRKIRRCTLGAISTVTFPSFVKPIIPKQFRGAVYGSGDELIAESRGLSPETAVFIAEPVTFTAEARTFVMTGEVLDSAVYEGREDTAGAGAFVAALSKEMPLPRSIVVDVGSIEGRGWSVIEFNAAWGSGLNGCNPDKVLPAIVAASGPQRTSFHPPV
jgi:hypothetical protein